MFIYVLALLMGVVAGLRAMMVPAAVSWAAHLGSLELAGSWLSFLAHPVTRWITTPLALLELVTDQLPKTPSRTVPPQFGARILTGALAGAAIGAGAGESWIVGAVAGVIGAVIGTLGGKAARVKLAASFGSDRPAAFTEDGVAILAAIGIVALLP